VSGIAGHARYPTSVSGTADSGRGRAALTSSGSGRDLMGNRGEHVTTATMRRRGFTLLEVMITIVMIAIIALIVIPRLLNVGRRAREATLREQLQALRKSVEHFRADCGALPPSLADLMADGGGAISADEDGNSVSVDRDGYRGPYLRTGDGELPIDPITKDHDWDYDTTTGDVHSSSTLTAIDGTTSDTW
jgi:prepilin-type N-terminal cleavage/methylation domain-containing protein